MLIFRDRIPKRTAPTESDRRDPQLTQLETILDLARTLLITQLITQGRLIIQDLPITHNRFLTLQGLSIGLASDAFSMGTSIVRTLFNVLD